LMYSFETHFLWDDTLPWRYILCDRHTSFETTHSLGDTFRVTHTLPFETTQFLGDTLGVTDTLPFRRHSSLETHLGS